MTIAPVTAMAMCGVRRRVWIVLSDTGSILSRLMEKATREDARMVAFKADIVDSSPPKIINTTPKAGMKLCAALAIAVS